MEAEEWRSVEDFEGLYEVSDLGRVRSLDRSFINKAGKYQTKPGKMLKPGFAKGYPRVRLFKNGDGYQITVHRLVMKTFVGPSDLTVDHINGDILDNRLENLRYCTIRENIHYFHEGKNNKTIGCYFHKGSFIAGIRIGGKNHHLGMYKTEEEGKKVFDKVLKEYLEHGKIPDKHIRDTKTSKYDDIDFHQASGKWRVRVRTDIYIGIFKEIETAVRVIALSNYMKKRGILSKDNILKVRNKFK